MVFLRVVLFLGVLLALGRSFPSHRESDTLDPFHADDDEHIQALNTEIDRLRDHLYVVGGDKAGSKTAGEVLLKCKNWVGLAQGLMAKDLRLKVHGGVLKGESFDAFDTSVLIAQEFVSKLSRQKESNNKSKSSSQNNIINANAATSLAEMSLQTLFHQGTYFRSIGEVNRAIDAQLRCLHIIVLLTKQAINAQMNAHKEDIDTDTDTISDNQFKTSIQYVLVSIVLSYGLCHGYLFLCLCVMVIISHIEWCIGSRCLLLSNPAILLKY